MNVFPTIYNTLSGWMSRYPFSSKQTSTKHTVHSWGHSSTDSSCFSYESNSQSTGVTQHSDLILAQMGMAWKQSQSDSQPQPQPRSQQRCYQHGSKPTAPPSPSPSTSSTVPEEAPVQEPWRSHHIFIESQDALVAAQRRFFRSVVRATEAHLEGLVDQDEVAMFGHFYPDARARLNQGFSGQNHLRLDEWDRSLECAREQFGNELIEMAQKMQYLHVDAMLELIGQVEGLYDPEIGVATGPLASSSTSLPTPATSPEPSRKRGLDDPDEKIVDSKAAKPSRPRPLKRARIETIKTEDRDVAIPPVLTSLSSLSTAAEALLASSSSLATPPPPPSAPASPKRVSQTSAAPRRRRRTTRTTRSGTKKNH